MLARALKSHSSFWLVLACAPPAIIAYIIARYGVDIPYWDDWAMADFLIKSRQHALTFSDWVAIHNEGRLVVPRFLALLSAEITNWDKRSLMFASLGITLITALSLYGVARRTIGQNAPMAFALASIFLFSTAQFINWLWAFQVALFIPAMCLAIGMWIAGLRESWKLRVAFAAALALVATYSFTNGMILWALLFPLLWISRNLSPSPLGGGQGRGGVSSRTASDILTPPLPNPPPRGEGTGGFIVVWTACAATALLLYFHHFHRAEWVPTWGQALTRPGDVIAYVLIVLGMPLGWGLYAGAKITCAIAGAAMLLLLASVLAYLWTHRKNRDLITRAAPWLVLACYAISSAVATSLGRATGLDLSEKLRYVTFAVHLPIALIFLITLVGNDLRNRLPGFRRGQIILSLSALAAAVLMLPACFQRIRLFNEMHLQGKGALELITLGESPALRQKIDPFSAGKLTTRSLALDELGLFHPRIHRDLNMAGFSTQSLAVSGILERVDHDENSIILTGWAILPDSRRSADDVIISARSPDGTETAIAYTDVFFARNEVAAIMGAPFQKCGWTIAIPLGKAPSTELKAWAYDSLTAKAYPLSAPPH